MPVGTTDGDDKDTRIARVICCPKSYSKQLSAQQHCYRHSIATSTSTIPIIPAMGPVSGTVRGNVKGHPPGSTTTSHDTATNKSGGKPPKYMFELLPRSRSLIFRREASFQTLIRRKHGNRGLNA